jgi:hypothetical protein
MSGKWQHTSLLQSAPPALAANRLSLNEEVKPESDEDGCLAFGYLRGIRDRALTVQLRYRDGNSDWFPYSWLGPVRFNPSVGLLLKFTGGVVTLVLIRGSNLDAPVNEGGMSLTVTAGSRGIASPGSGRWTRTS